MEEVVSEQLDAASIEARIMSLDATSITILGWLPSCRNDSDIVKKSGAWNYSLATVVRSLKRIYKIFDIDSFDCETSKRKRAIELYHVFKNAKYPETAFSRRGKTDIRENVARDFISAYTEESVEMGVEDNLDCNRVGTLNRVQLKILKALAKGKDKYEVAHEVQILPAQVADEVPHIFAHLHITSHSLNEKRQIACELYEEYVSLHGEPVGVEVGTSTTVVGSSEREVSAWVGVGEYDFNHLASLIAGLSPRVKQVAGHLADGLNVSAIAKAMSISEASVQPYASNVYSKLGLHHSLGAEKRQGLLKLAYARFLSGDYEVAVVEKPAEAKPPPASDDVFPMEFQGVNITVVAQKLKKLTPRLQELALCLIRAKDPLKELEVAPSTLSAYKGSLYSQLGLTGRGLTKKERLKVLELAYEEAFRTTSYAPPAKVEVTPPSVLEEEVPSESQVVAPAPGPVAGVLPRKEEDSLPPEAASQYGQGVPIILSDPETIVDVSVISGRHREGAFDKEVQQKRQSGFHPEVLVVYPTANPAVNFVQLILIKRKG